MDRSIRIHHRDRIKNKVKKYISVRYRLYQSSSEDINRRVLGIRSNTRANCSCHMCGNSRKYFGEITIQEKRQLDIFKSYRDDQNIL